MATPQTNQPNSAAANQNSEPLTPSNQASGQPQTEGNQQQAQSNSTDGATGDSNNVAEVKLPGMTPEQVKLYNKQLAAARKAGEVKGKQLAEDVQQQHQQQEQAVAQKQRGEFEQLYNTETVNHTATQSKLANLQSEHDKLRAALEANVPNPTTNFKRIVGDTYEDILEDAKQLAQSFTSTAYRDPSTPPTIPNANDGGQFSQSQTNGKTITQEQLDQNRRGYNFM